MHLFIMSFHLNPPLFTNHILSLVNQFSSTSHSIYKDMFDNIIMFLKIYQLIKTSYYNISINIFN